MIRSVFTLAALSVIAAPAAAANYSATLAHPITARFITRDISWNCGPSACQAATDESRPLVLCESVARRAGQVETFLVDGSPLSAADLQRCNASARSQQAQSVASR